MKQQNKQCIFLDHQFYLIKTRFVIKKERYIMKSNGKKKSTRLKKKNTPDCRGYFVANWQNPGVRHSLFFCH